MRIDYKSTGGFERRILEGSKRHALVRYSEKRRGVWEQTEKIYHGVREGRTARYFRIQDNPGSVQVVRLELSEKGWIDVYVLNEATGEYRKLGVAQREVFIQREGFDNEERFVAWFRDDIRRGKVAYLLVHFYGGFRY